MNRVHISMIWLSPVYADEGLDGRKPSLALPCITYYYLTTVLVLCIAETMSLKHVGSCLKRTLLMFTMYGLYEYIVVDTAGFY